MGRVFTIHKTISLPAERILKCFTYPDFEMAMEWLFTFLEAIAWFAMWAYLKKLHFISVYFK